MKNNITGNTVVCDTGENKSFGMLANAKAYSILVSGIYQYKIEAIVRELSTNAVDSQKQAGNFSQFEVHLPTHHEPEFTIRDFGTGLSREELEGIYFNFFASTKEDSNEYTGFIGIGSKSPLCYNTKSFNVESWKDGKHYIYLCNIGDGGVPDYNFVLEEESNEPSGLKIQVSVNPNDIDEFKECAEKIYRWFDIKPKFIGEQADISDPCILRNEVFGIYDDYKTIALMGNVSYPINYHPALSSYKTFIDKKLVLFFDIGEIEFNAAREGLEYTPKTIKKIKEKFDQVLCRIESEIEKKITNSKSTFEAIKNWKLMKREVAGQLGCSHLIKNNFEYNGENILVHDYNIKNERFPVYGRSKEHLVLCPEPDVIYVHNDMKVGAKGRCKLLTQKGQTVCLLNVNDNLPIDISESDYILASSLPKPARTSTTRNKVSSFMRMLNTSYVTQAWAAEDIKNATSKYYVIRKGYYVEHDGTEYNPYTVYKRLKACGITDDVYGINKKEEQSVIDAGFINVLDHSKIELEKKYQEILKEVPDIEKYLENKAIYDSNYRFFNNIKYFKNKLSNNHELLSLLDIEKYISKNKDKVSQLLKDIKFLEENKLFVKYNSSFSTNNSIIQKYNLLSSFYINEDMFKDLRYYILGVDYENSREKF